MGLNVRKERVLTMDAGPAVLVENIAKSFGDVEAVKGVSLEIGEGSIYALLGPNGAGKTTLIRILTTLLLPDSGRALVAGIDVLDDPVAVRERIGLAGQNAALDDYLTAWENLEMIGRLYNLPTAEARRRAGEVLERIHLSDARDRQVRTYSGGMRRRLDLAASLVGRPQVLFLDEPTTGVDPRSRLDLWSLIQELVDEGATVLLTTQYLEEADYLADKIGVIDHGLLITEGTADELKTKMGASVVELSVDEPFRTSAAEVLGRVNGDKATVDEWSGHVSIPAPDGAATLMEAVRQLDEAGITPNDIALHKPTLDDVFLTLTGRAASTEAEATPHRRQRRKR